MRGVGLGKVRVRGFTHALVILFIIFHPLLPARSRARTLCPHRTKESAHETRMQTNLTCFAVIQIQA